jgi:S-adenosylmethionine hydrolase
MPSKATYLAVVDPGVGTDRPSLAVEARSGDLFVGPDNGLLWPAVERAGGPATVVQIASRAVVMEPVSATFHGRDVFAPAAAHLSNGRPLEELGPDVDVSALQHVEIPAPGIADGELAAVAIAVDRFGNVQLNARPDDLAEAGLAGADPLRIRHPGGEAEVRVARTFADGMPGELLLVEDSSAFLALVANHGSAADLLGIGPGHELTLLR